MKRFQTALKSAKKKLHPKSEFYKYQHMRVKKQSWPEISRIEELPSRYAEGMES